MFRRNFSAAESTFRGGSDDPDERRQVSDRPLHRRLHVPNWLLRVAPWIRATWRRQCELSPKTAFPFFPTSSRTAGRSLSKTFNFYFFSTSRAESTLPTRWPSPLSRGTTWSASRRGAFTSYPGHCIKTSERRLRRMRSFAKQRSRSCVYFT